MRIFKTGSPFAPLWFLVVATPLIIESCITASTPASHWLNPVTCLMLVLAYGPPVLWLRELWVRGQLALPALFIMGIAYGLFNEGILAHTLTQIAGDPAKNFIGYDEWGGIHWAWASLILPWHGFNSVCFMVLLTHLFFPAHSRTPWLSDKAQKRLGYVILLSLGLYFAVHTPERLAPPHVFFVYIPILLLVMGAAIKWPRRWTETTGPTQRQLVASVMMGLLPNILILMAGFGFAENKVPLPLYFLLTIGVTGLVIWSLGHCRWQRTLAFMLGGTWPLAAFTHFVTGGLTSMIFFASYLTLSILALRKLLAAAVLVPNNETIRQKG